VPIAVLAAPSVLLGAFLPALAPALDAVAAAWGAASGAPRLASLAPLGWLPAAFAGLCGTVAALALFLGSRVRKASAGPTWDCGYAAPTARMQYTSASFAEWIAERFLPSSLRRAAAVRAPRGLFPAPARFALETPAEDPVRRRVYEPFLARWAERFSALRTLQQGRLPIYLVYVFVTLLALLGWAAVRNILVGG
jgi:hydrogenase-4 component B